jgi:hypothetical protein
MVFKNGGQLSKYEHWHYFGKNIEVVKGFDYVGVHFTSKLSMYKMAEHNY